ncbi:MAG: xylose isomerase, partial [Deltaproteobacteria bacterium]|nr:xylose isomerase [Deltaproteobacteria bacterium]
MYKIKDLSYQKKERTKKELITHMKNFTLNIKMSVGIWYFTPRGGRFHEDYVKPASIAERLKMAADFAEFGITGIEAHFPDEVNFDNLHLYKDLEKKCGIRLVGVPFSHFFNKDFEFGSLSNPNPK